MCTLEKRGSLFILTLTGDTNKDQHRLNPTLISSIRSALAQVKSQAVNGSALITLSQGRFFSNGFDLNHAQSVGAKYGSVKAAKDELILMVDLFKGVVADYLSLPMPTVAAAVMYMSELDIGMSLPDYFMAMIRGKVGSASSRRDLVLRAAKVSAEEAVGMGIVDSTHGSAEEVVAAAFGVAEELGKRKWSGDAYAAIRKSLYPEVCGLLGLKCEEVMPSKL
ncbi:hypothetical protein ACJIZ3_017512 [Penstemon smallii]|uniref:Enoyl-CoA hydratase n=1 Tax=Penstemon smallii TaxID=265156 RepID=A0ABD3SVR6_9LAMI